MTDVSDNDQQLPEDTYVTLPDNLLIQSRKKVGSLSWTFIFTQEMLN